MSDDAKVFTKEQLIAIIEKAFKNSDKTNSQIIAELYDALLAEIERFS